MKYSIPQMSVKMKAATVTLAVVTVSVIGHLAITAAVKSFDSWADGAAIERVKSNSLLESQVETKTVEVVVKTDAAKLYAEGVEDGLKAKAAK